LNGNIEIATLLGYYLPALILSMGIFFFKGILVIKSSRITTLLSLNAVFLRRSLFFQTMSEESSLKPLDILFQRMYGLDVYLIDSQYLGRVTDYVVEKESWDIRAIRVDLDKKYSEETGENTILVPTENANIYLDEGQLRITVNAIYILGDSFSQEKWFT
jgi:sporulation protein YlmC with PRC-barrel domain